MKGIIMDKEQKEKVSKKDKVKEKTKKELKDMKNIKETKTKENMKNKECFENKNNKDKDNKKCILNNIKNSMNSMKCNMKNFKCICNKERIANMFKNEKVVFKTNIVTYILFAIIAFFIQNSIVQEIQLGLRNNTCKQTCKPILTTYDNSNSSICINAILRKTS
jgi:hypothetical protein